MPITLFIIAISLSMDAFSLSIAYGTFNLELKKILLLSIVVGIYHFIMPILGHYIGSYIYEIIPIKPNIIVFVVLCVIGIEMILESQEKEDVHILKKTEIIFFGLAVSIDSFTVGIILNQITSNIFLSAVIFSITSAIFTYIGLYIGKKITIKLGYIATILGAITLIILGISYL